MQSTESHGTGTGGLPSSSYSSGLDLGRAYLYRVRSNGKAVAEGRITTRKPRGQRTRFVAFGDNSYGDIGDSRHCLLEPAASVYMTLSTPKTRRSGGMQDGSADCVARFVSDRHSLSIIDLDGASLTFTQVNESGGTIDQFGVSKT